MKHSLQLRLSQHLTLTPQLQQSIRLLQLSTLELNQEIERFLQENPLLERDEGAGEQLGVPPGLNGDDSAAERTRSGQRVPPAATTTPAQPDSDAFDQRTGCAVRQRRDAKTATTTIIPQVAAEARRCASTCITQLALIKLSDRDRSSSRC